MENVIRPAVTVLAESAQIPEHNLIRPPPNCFTHELKIEQPYYFVDPAQAAAPEGRFQVGTKIVIMVHDGGPTCRVVDHQGLYVATAFEGLVLLRGQGN
jgi:hypothetical protein